MCFFFLKSFQKLQRNVLNIYEREKEKMAWYSKFAEIKNKGKDHNTGGKWNHLKGRSNICRMKFYSENLKVMHLGPHKRP